MSYRSDVTYIIEGQDVPGLIARIKMSDQTLTTFLKEKCKVSEKSIGFLASQWEWDTQSNQEAATARKVFDMGKEHAKCSGYLLRVGEEYEDVEYDVYGENPPFGRIRLIRGIDVDDACFNDPV
jgi:hypothetical protein